MRFAALYDATTVEKQQAIKEVNEPLEKFTADIQKFPCDPQDL